MVLEEVELVLQVAELAPVLEEPEQQSKRTNGNDKKGRKCSPTAAVP
jgi:hypothetical protein